MIRLLALLLLLAGPTHALELPELWPPRSELNEYEGRPVSYPSHSPYTLADVGKGGDDDPETPARAVLFLPPAATAANKVPAVVMLHGSGGVLYGREMTYGRQFASMGMAALVVDAFAARRDRATSFIDRLMEITETMLLADAYAGLTYLDKLGVVDMERVVLMGFSYGAMATTYGLQAQAAHLLAPGGHRFAAHVAFYGPCIARFQDVHTTGAPLLMVWGGKDDIMEPDRCAEVRRDVESGGSRVETIVYPEGFHQWDGDWGGPRRIGRRLGKCRFEVERDGTVRDLGTGMAMAGTFSRKLILFLCADSDGYLIGRDDNVRAQSNRDVARFLNRVLKPGGASVIRVRG